MDHPLTGEGFEAAVQDMKPMEAVRYLIEGHKARDLADSDYNEDHPLRGIIGGKVKIAIWMKIWRRRGNVVPIQMLESSCGIGTNANENVRVHIRKIRRALAGTGWRIDTIWGAGYRLVPEDAPPPPRVERDL